MRVEGLLVAVIGEIIIRTAGIIILFLMFILLARRRGSSLSEASMGSSSIWSIFSGIWFVCILSYLVPLLVGFTVYSDLSALFVRHGKLSSLSIFLVCVLVVLTAWMLVRHEYSPTKALGLAAVDVRSGLMWGLIFLLVLEIVFGVLKASPRAALIFSNRIKFEIPFLLSNLIAVPVAEEVFYRGYLYTVLKKQSGRAYGMLFSSAAFALAHQNWQTMLGVLLLGMILCLQYEKSKSIVAAIIAHSGFNTLGLMINCQYGNFIRLTSWNELSLVLIFTVLLIILTRKGSLRRKGINHIPST